MFNKDREFLICSIYATLFFFWNHDLYLVKNPAGIKAFGTHLRKIREAKGISQQELADISNISKSTILRTENAQFAVTLDVLLSISEALEIPLRDLVDFPTNK